MDICGDDVDDGANDTGDLREGAHRLRGSNRAVIPSSLKRALHLRDERSKVARANEMVENSFVAHDHHLHHTVVPAEMLGDILDLRRRSLDSLLVDINADNQRQAVGGGGGRNVSEPAAVGAVKADGAEAFTGDGGDV